MLASIVHYIGIQFPGCRMIITKDQAWLSTFREVSNILLGMNMSVKSAVFQDEEIVFDPEQLLEQVLAFHDIYITNGQHLYI